MSVLRLREFNVEYDGEVWAVRNVSLAIEKGERVVVLGESGCGKSTLAKALLRLLPASARLSGHATINGQHDVIRLEADGARNLRGLTVGFVPQNPLTAFNPLRSVGTQLQEAWTCHGKPLARGDLVTRLEEAGIPQAQGYVDRRPSEWSGGMLQRALILAATAHRPRLVVADEPTSAVDRPLARQMMELLVDQSETLLTISHDIDLVQDLASRIVVMYGGTIVEDGPAPDVTAAPRHPYTRALFNAMPTPGKLPQELPGEPPSLKLRNKGCVFAPRCQFASSKCGETPSLKNGVACHHPLQEPA